MTFTPPSFRFAQFQQYPHLPRHRLSLARFFEFSFFYLPPRQNRSKIRHPVRRDWIRKISPASSRPGMPESAPYSENNVPYVQIPSLHRLFFPDLRSLPSVSSDISKSESLTEYRILPFFFILCCPHIHTHPA